MRSTCCSYDGGSEAVACCQKFEQRHLLDRMGEDYCVAISLSLPLPAMLY